MHFKSHILHLIFCIVLFTISGCDRDDTSRPSSDVSINLANSFLQYPNMQAGLAAGTYTLVAATANTSETGSFTLNITLNDGTTIEKTGSWTSSGGQDETSMANPRFNFTIKRAGGATVSLTSSVDNYLFLLDRGDNILYQDDNSGTNNNALLNIPSSLINNKAWTQAYYAAIDPYNERDSLHKWKSRNGFDQGHDVHVIFRDTKDLGYGRSVFMRENTNGCLALYVENFRVDAIAGIPYSSLNLAAAIENDRLHHFGSNAIEFSDLDGDCDGSDPMFNKFFTFKADPTKPNADEPRLLSVDLDGRGEKYMPLPCITCHGGNAMPLLADGTFPSAALPGQTNPELRIGDTNSKLQPLEVDSFEYSNVSGYTRSDQETKLKQINTVVFNSFPASRASGEWDGDFIREVVDGWYGGHFLTASNNKSFNKNFVPYGWQYNPSDIAIPGTRPANSEELFLKVIKPYCFACHSKRGTTLGSDSNDSNFSGKSKDVNFSSYEKFISHAEQIENYIFARGIMPMSKLTYDKFWEGTAPAILASHIPSFQYYDENGNVTQPGKPVANAGIDRTVRSPATLSAEASSFVDTYSWLITQQPGGSNASINDTTDIRPSLTADFNGVYTLQLTATNSETGKSHSDSVDITIDSSLLPAQQDITFTADIQPFMSSNCAGCHYGTYVTGIPLYYDVNSNGYSAYQNVRQRMNFAYPEFSKILRKPTGNHHYGSTVIGNSADYNMFLNWVLEGGRIN